MKKLINSPADAVWQSLEGLVLAHPDLLELDPQYRFVRRKTLAPGKVALVSGGGSGHEPLHVGFVGPGMLDAACPGAVFTSPTPGQIAAAARAVSGAAGCLFVVKNYAGDVMNFEMAAEMLALPLATVLVSDDVVTARGIAGTLLIEKVLGAAAQAGADLNSLQALGRSLNERTRSMGAALSSGVMPASARPTFELGEAEMEMGVGIHGEPGRWRAPLGTADEITSQLLDGILAELAPRPGSSCVILVNGLGATPAMELYVMARAAVRGLRARGLLPVRQLVGSFVTSLDMAGCSLTISLMESKELEWWLAPVHTTALRWGC